MNSLLDIALLLIAFLALFFVAEWIGRSGGFHGDNDWGDE